MGPDGSEIARAEAPATWWFRTVDPRSVRVRVIGDALGDDEVPRFAHTLRLCLGERAVTRVLLDLSGIGEIGVLGEVISVLQQEARRMGKTLSVTGREAVEATNTRA